MRGERVELGIFDIERSVATGPVERHGHVSEQAVVHNWKAVVLPDGTVHRDVCEYALGMWLGERFPGETVVLRRMEAEKIPVDPFDEIRKEPRIVS